MPSMVGLAFLHKNINDKNNNDGLLDPQKKALETVGIRRVSFVMNHDPSEEFDEYCSPALFSNSRTDSSLVYR